MNLNFEQTSFVSLRFVILLMLARWARVPEELDMLLQCAVGIPRLAVQFFLQSSKSHLEHLTPGKLSFNTSTVNHAAIRMLARTVLNGPQPRIILARNTPESLRDRTSHGCHSSDNSFFPQPAPKFCRAILNSLTAVLTSSKLSAEMAHFACFCAAIIESSSVL